VVVVALVMMELVIVFVAFFNGCVVCSCGGGCGKSVSAVPTIIAVSVVPTAEIQRTFLSCYTQICSFVILSYEIKFFFFFLCVMNNFGSMQK
jgi:hypothetical protein